MSITWNRLGYSFVENAEVNANLSAHAVKSNRSNTGGGRSADFPSNGNIQSIEVFFFNFDNRLANCTEGTIYAVMKVDAGVVSADVRVNWRGV